MRQLHKNRISFILGITLICLPYFSRVCVVHAETPIEHYQKIFASWGIDADTTSAARFGDFSGSTKGVTDELNVKKKSDHLLLLSSQEYAGNNLYKNVFLICDTDYFLSPTPSAPCTSNSLWGYDFSLLADFDLLFDKSIQKVVTPTYIGQSKYYFIPEILLTSSVYLPKIGDYIKALSRVESTEVAGSEKSSTAAREELLAVLVESSSIKVTLSILLVLMFVVLMKSLLMLVISGRKHSTIRDFVARFFLTPPSFVAKHRQAFLLLFLIATILYVAVLYIMRLKGQLVEDSQYINNYLSYLYNPSNFKEILLSKNMFKLGLLIFSFLYFLATFLAIFPIVGSSVIKSVKIFFRVRLKPEYLKALILIIVFANIPFLIFPEGEETPFFLMFNLVVLFLLGLYIKKRSIDYLSLFSSRQKLINIAASLLLLVLFIIYRNYESGRPVDYLQAKLVSGKYEVVLLPYSIEWNEPTTFLPFFYHGEQNIFVDGYMIYSPHARRIVNLPLEQLNKEDDAVIMSGKFDDIISLVLKDTGYVSYIKVEEFSPLFIVDDYIGDGFIRVEFTIDCSYIAPPKQLKFELYSKGTSEGRNTNLKRMLVDVLEFPGCVGKGGIKKFFAPIDARSLPLEGSVVRIRGVDGINIRSMKLFRGDGELSVVFINGNILDNKKYTVLHKPNRLGKEITVYSPSVKQETIFDIVTTGKGFNLSQPINQLMKANLLNNPFIIWSDNGMEVIQK